MKKQCGACKDGPDTVKAVNGFEAGDIVEAFGVAGVVMKIDSRVEYPIQVTFDGSINGVTFTADGRLNYWHKEPTLKFISRPKKKVKKTFYMGVGSYGNPTSSSKLYEEKDMYGWDQIVEVQIEVEE